MNYLINELIDEAKEVHDLAQNFAQEYSNQYNYLCGKSVAITEVVCRLIKLEMELQNKKTQI